MNSDWQHCEPDARLDEVSTAKRVMNLDEIFPHQVCINLDTRPDRWQRMTARFAEHELRNVRRFPAVAGNTLEIPGAWKHSRGAYGCLRSHLSVIEHARDHSQPSVLIFEDDAVFDPQLNTRFSAFAEQLPGDWDVVYFGGLHGKPPREVSANVVRVSYTLSTYAYALKHTIYDAFIDLNRRAETVLDENTRALQERFNCYCFMPHLAWVEEDYSDVQDEKVDLWWLRESLVLFGDEVDGILEKTAAIVFHRAGSPAAQRNLQFLIDYFTEKLPAVSLLVVEQDKCERSCAFNLGFQKFEQDKDFFLFFDSDVFLTREDIRANLLKIREYDFASGFSEICDLSEAETSRILNDDVRWNYQASRKKTSVCESFCVYTKRGMQLVGGWAKGDDERSSLTSEKVRQLLRVYSSPNRARHLFT
jgi:glycosyl transferase, family 25